MLTAVYFGGNSCSPSQLLICLMSSHPARPYKNYLDGQSLARNIKATISDKLWESCPFHGPLHRRTWHLIAWVCTWYVWNALYLPKASKGSLTPFFSHLTPHLKYFWNWTRYKHPQKELKLSSVHPDEERVLQIFPKCNEFKSQKVKGYMALRITDLDTSLCSKISVYCLIWIINAYVLRSIYN